MGSLKERIIKGRVGQRRVKAPSTRVLLFSLVQAKIKDVKPQSLSLGGNLQDRLCPVPTELPLE